MTLKKLVLVFPPFVQASSPPLGICSLKGYIERALQDWKVSTLDLNLLAQEKALAAVQQRPSRIFKEGVLAEIALAEAEKCFRGGNDYDFYYRPDRYVVYADMFQRLLQQETANAVRLESVITNESPIPPLLDSCADLILSEHPDAVGLSLCYTHQAWAGICLAKAIKRKRNVPIIFGGTFFDDAAAGFLADHGDIADFVVHGEGEKPLELLLQNLSSAREIPGISFVRKGHVVTTEPLYETDVDSLGHPDFSGLDLTRYFSPSPVLPVITSRGCYWRRCTFCTHYKSAGLTYRRHSIGHVIEELSGHVARGCEHFALIDEMISPHAFEQLATALLDANLSINYYALAKPGKGFTRELLQKIAASGCRYVLWGVESGSSRILNLMDKGTEAHEMSRVLQDAHAAGVENHVFMLYGFPTESLDDFLASMRFLDENKNAIYGVQNCVFDLRPGSPVFADPDKYSIRAVQQVGDYRSFGGYGYQCSIGLSHAQVDELVSKCAPFLSAFNPFSGALQNQRDHALLIYARHGGGLRKLPRNFPVLQL